MTLSGDDLTVQDVLAIAVDYEPVALDKGKLSRVAATFESVQRWGHDREPIYGVNTGFGELAHVIIPPSYKTQLQQNLLLSHAAGYGSYFPDEVVRAIMTVRLNCLMKGYSGVSPQAVRMLEDFLNLGIHPVIPEQGSLGASGDLAPLAHMALPLIGNGEVRVKGRITSGAAALAEYSLKPLSLGFKEALALVNGTSAMTGVACIALAKAFRLLEIAVFASAEVVQCLEASICPFNHKGHELKNHAGQIEIASALRHLLSDSQLTRNHSDIMRSIKERASRRPDVADTGVYIQNAYTLRCIPQILGPVLDTLRFCTTIITEELNSCNDNPLFFESPEETFHGGNFHGQYVAAACDYVNIALAEIGVLAERQLNRILDPHVNGTLPDFLAIGDPGLFSGFEGAQYLATSIASENLDLAAPSSVKSIPSNGSNQDVVSMGLISARKSISLCENVSTILAVLVCACHQAKNFLDINKFSTPAKRLRNKLAQTVPPYRDDQPICNLIASVRAFLLGPEFQAVCGKSLRFNSTATDPAKLGAFGQHHYR